MRVECLEGVFGFVPMPLQKEQEPLLVKELSIVVEFVFSDILVKLVQLFAFVLVMFDLSEKEEAGAFFALFGFLFFLCIAHRVLLGKKR